MRLRLKISDVNRKQRGSVHLRLIWGSSQWFLEEDRSGLWKEMGFAAYGTFERKSWGVAWLWDVDSLGKRRAIAVIWNPPQGEVDHRNITGILRICDSTNPLFHDSRSNWEVVNPMGMLRGPSWPEVNWTYLSERRRFVLSELEKVLDHKYMDDNYVKVTGGLRKNDQNVQDAEEWEKSNGKPIPLDLPDGKGGTRKGSVENGEVKKKRKYTTCGSLTSYVATLLKDTTGFGGTNGIRTKGLLYNAWVKATGRNRPLPGDLYALLDGTGKIITHVGVIQDATGDIWTTADTGQGGGWDGKKGVRRKYNPVTNRLAGEILQGGGDRKLAGWVDLDTYPFPYLRSEHRYHKTWAQREGIED